MSAPSPVEDAGRPEGANADGIRRVAVLGAGTMGHGIAQVAALTGCATWMYDVDEPTLAAAVDRIRANLDKGVSLGKVDAAEREGALKRLRTTTELAEAVREAELVVEAVPEDLDLKQQLFRTVEQACSPESILATNTSALSVSRVAEGLDHPERLLGLHFFNPVHVMALVEVVRGEATRDPVVETAVDFARGLGKEPIVVHDSPGFATSRLGLALGLEAMRMVEQGVASAPDIDRAMELGYRHPMGPLRLTDLVGLDIRLGIAEYLHAELESEAFRPPEILRSMVAAGKLGKKSGEGFYRWDGGP